MSPQVKIYNEDGTFTIREFNDEELKVLESDKAAFLAIQSADKLAAATKASAIAKLTSSTYKPLTPEEAATVVIDET